MPKLVRLSNKRMIKYTLSGEPSIPGYVQITSNMVKRTANLSDLTDVVKARKNLGIEATGSIEIGAVPDSIVQRDSTGKFKILDAEATNEPVSLNQLNTKQYSLESSNITGITPIMKGGTGANTAARGFAALGGKALGKLDSIALTDNKITGTLTLAKGGTGATTAANARTNLGLGSLATQSSIALTSSNLTGALPISKGGTGATTVEAARNNLGVNIAELPIGFIYFQLRGMLEPSILFPNRGKWQDISSSFSGQFFRVAGGEAASFGYIQSRGIPQLYGTFPNGNEKDDYVPTGPFFKLYQFTNTTAYNGTRHPSVITMDANKYNSSYNTSGDVRPLNSTIRVWKKIS